MKRDYEKQHYEGIKFYLGEIVVMKRQQWLGEPSKLRAKYWINSMQVIEALPSNTYCVADIRSEGRYLYSTTMHVSNLKSSRTLQKNDENGEAKKIEICSSPERALQKEGTVAIHPTRERRLPAYLENYDTTD